MTHVAGKGKWFAAALCTALAPCLWGTTYVVFREGLPSDYPLTVGALRALPAGILLMSLGPGLPPRKDILRLSTLGLLNIGLFFGLLFVSAARLPGGVAATVTSTQPLLVGLIAWPLLGSKVSAQQLAVALLGVLGIAVLVSAPTEALDGWGIAAALSAAGSMATGTVLIESWRRMASPLSLAAWQLSLGGLLLLPVALWVEGAPPVPTLSNLGAMTYLTVIGTALAYWLWVRGTTQLGASVAYLGLLSPLVATALGATLLGERLSVNQWCGLAVVLVSLGAGMTLARRKRLLNPKLSRLRATTRYELAQQEVRNR